MSLIATSKIRKKRKRKEKKEREVKVVAGRIEELEKEDKGRNYHFKVIIQVLCWNKSCGPNGITLLFFENGFTLLLSRNVVGMHFLFIVDYR